jgi:hypothetical protein
VLLVATSATPMSAATVATTTAAASITATTTTSAATSTATRTATAAARTISAAIAGTRGLRGIDAIEVGFITLFELSAAFERQASAGNWRCDCNGIHLSSFFSAFTFAAIGGRSATTHFRALLFQDSFARKANTIAFNGQYFHQHLIAFFQLVTNIFNAVLGDFADMQQAFGAGMISTNAPKSASRVTLPR